MRWFHHKLACNERFKLFFDNGDFNIIQTPTPVDDPLNFVANNKKYSDKLDQSENLQNKMMQLWWLRVE